MTEYLTRDQILDADDRQYEDVPVPEWGGTVCTRSLSGAERDAFEAEITIRHRDRSGAVQSIEVRTENLRALLASMTIVSGPGGDPIFSEADVVALGQKSAAALQRVWNRARRLSGLTDEDVEELVGNSGAGQSGDSTSA